MSRINLSSALLVVCACGAVASAGVVGSYAVIGSLMASDAAAVPTSADVTTAVLPVRINTSAGGGLAPATNATVSFIHQGVPVVETPVGPDGTAEVSGLRTAPHSVFVSGPDGFAAFGAWLNPGAASGPGSLVDINLVPPQDVPVVEQVIDSYLNAGPDASASQSGQAPSGTYEPDSSGHEVIQGYGFEIGDDGVVRGQIIRAAAPTEPQIPLAGLDVFFIHSGGIVSRSQTGQDGIFQASNMKPGVHSFLVAGPGSILALAVEVQSTAPGIAARMTELPLGGSATEEVAHVDNDEVSLTASQVTVAYASPVFPGDLQFLQGQGLLGQGPPPGFGGGGGLGGGGGGLGGGGGSGGGGGLGPLLALAALGAAAAALADDDDNNNNPPIISPAIP